MKERPILFSGAMVRALLAGTKTQTRRVANKMVQHPDLGNLYTPGALVLEHEPHHVIDRSCPYGAPGDRLWVRESGWERPERTPKMMREGADTWAPYYYAADGEDGDQLREWGFKVRPSIHMPRWACRIVLEIVSVRVERLNDIRGNDCIAEGAWREEDKALGRSSEAIKAFSTLWESINGAGSWAANPWVWVIEFKRIESAAKEAA